MINRAFALRALLRRSRAPFSDDNPKNPSVLDCAELELDVKSELKKKFTGEVISNSLPTQFRKNTTRIHQHSMIATCRSGKNPSSAMMDCNSHISLSSKDCLFSSPTSKDRLSPTGIDTLMPRELDFMWIFLRI